MLRKGRALGICRGRFVCLLVCEALDLWCASLARALCPFGKRDGNVIAPAPTCCRLNLTSWGDKPLVGVVSRLTKQKGEPAGAVCQSIWPTC